MEEIGHLDFEPWEQAYSEVDAQGAIHERYTAEDDTVKLVYTSTTGEVMTVYAEDGETLSVLFRSQMAPS
jgi:hypothetical protein